MMRFSWTENGVTIQYSKDDSKEERQLVEAGIQSLLATLRIWNRELGGLVEETGAWAPVRPVPTVGSGDKVPPGDATIAPYTPPAH